MGIEGFQLFILQRGICQRTMTRYVRDIKNISTQIDIQNEQEVSQFLATKIQTLGSGGFNHYVRVFRIYFKYLGIPPFSCFRKITEKPKSRILFTDEEIQQFINIDPPPRKYGVFWMLLAHTGMRPGEACTLVQDQIDATAGVIYLHKTKTIARKVPLLEPLRTVLLEYVSGLETDLLFPVLNVPNRPITYASYMKDWKKRLHTLKIKKKVQPYSLRHSFITDTLGNGADLFAIQDTVGHVNANTTRKYYHGNIDLMKKAMKKLTLNKAHQTPQELLQPAVEYVNELLKDDRFKTDNLAEALKHLYKSLKK